MKNVGQLRVVRGSQIHERVLVHDEVDELGSGDSDIRARRPSVLVRPVIGLSIWEHSKDSDELLELISLWLPSSVDPARQKMLVLDGFVDASENTARHTEAPLKVLVGVDRRPTVKCQSSRSRWLCSRRQILAVGCSSCQAESRVACAAQPGEHGDNGWRSTPRPRFQERS